MAAGAGEYREVNPDQADQTQRALADLDARLGRITAEIADVRAGLAALGRQAAPASPVPGPSVSAPSVSAPAGTPGPTAASPSGPWRPPAQPGRAHPDRPWQQAPGPYPPVGPGVDARTQPGPAASTRRGPVRPDRPWQQAEPGPRRAPRITAATVIAAIGGAVMLAGVAFLLVVAIQAGLFPPAARVVAAAALAAVLVLLGLRLQSRHEATTERPINPGALALVGTGLAAAMLDVIACTSLYQWIPMQAAYLFVGGLAVGGMALAQRWSSGLLACLVSAGTMLLAPLISTGVELPVFLVIVGIATAVLAADLGKAARFVWSVLPAPVVLGYLSQTQLHDRGEEIALIVAALGFAAVGAAVAWFDSVRRSPAPENAALVVVPTALPLVLLPSLPLLQPGWPVGLVLAAAYTAVAVAAGRVDRRPETVLLSAVTGLAGSVLLLVSWVELGGRELTGFALTLSAIAYVVAGGLWERRWVDWAAGLGAGLALAVYVAVDEPFLALSERMAVRELTYWDVVSAFAVTILAAAVTWWAARRLPREAARVVMAGAVVGLMTASVMVVAMGVVIGDLAGAARNGFLVAHLVVTVLWICCAAWLVLTPRPRIADSRRLGFVLGSLALAKLLLLDLATLPGLFRVLSFIAVGAVMLAVAVRYRGGPGTDDAGPGDGGPSYRSETEPSGSGSPT